VENDVSRPVIGIVPAAGKATRLPRCMCSKELLPIGEATGLDGCRPKAVSEYLFDALVAADADRVCVVIAPEKHDILRFYGSGERHGVPIAYVCQEVPTGMADAIDAAYPWIGDATVLMGMPDTIFRPVDALAKLRVFYEQEHADLALAVAPTDEPGRLGPVLVDAGGRVLEVMDKPEAPPHNNVWVVACWGATFTEFLHSYLAARRPSHDVVSGFPSTALGAGSRTEVALGSIFQAFVERGSRVRALSFDDGFYIDAGTMEGLRAAQRVVASVSTKPVLT
jgi:glucose-1-phosphate thymidylyltransferase